MIKLTDLPKELQDVIYIEDCHISGMHNPSHTTEYVCNEQLTDLAKRVLGVLGINLTKKTVGANDYNKIPRRIVKPEHPTKYSWYQYYLDTPQYKSKAKELEVWQKKGFQKRVGKK